MQRPQRRTIKGAVRIATTEGFAATVADAAPWAIPHMRQRVAFQRSQRGEQATIMRAMNLPDLPQTVALGTNGQGHRHDRLLCLRKIKRDQLWRITTLRLVIWPIVMCATMRAYIKAGRLCSGLNAILNQLLAIKSAVGRAGRISPGTRRATHPVKRRV